MIKNKKLFLLIMIPILIVIIFCLLMFKSNSKQKEEKIIELSNIFVDINDFYLNEFRIIDSIENSELFIPVDFSGYEEKLISVSYLNSNEYYVIIKNLTDEDLQELKNYISLEKENSNKYYNDTKVVTKNNYTYIIATLEKNSIIEGIISSYIY